MFCLSEERAGGFASTVHGVTGTSKKKDNVLGNGLSGLDLKERNSQHNYHCVVNIRR